MTIYLDDRDRQRFLDILARSVQEHKVDCHAYCLMSTHYHLVVQTHEANLSKAIRQVNGVYAQWWNRRHHRVGHVMQGRFKAQLIQADDYFLEACRYVVLNPVRGGLVNHVAEWPWSSYRATAGSAPCPPLLSVDVLRGHFAGIHTYQAFIDAGVKESAVAAAIRSDERVIGDTAFVAAFQSQLENANRTEVPSRERRIGRTRLEDLFKGVTSRRLRNRRIREARERHCYSVADIARYLGLHYATVSRISGTRLRTLAERSPGHHSDDQEMLKFKT